MNQLPARFESKIERVAESGCWIWMGAMTRSGYGHVKIGGSRSNAMAHRAVFESVMGSVPLGMDLDHLCRVRACVNPSHLEPVSRRENLRRGGVIDRLQRRAAALHSAAACSKGHAMTPENTYTYPNGRHRGCRECIRAYRRAKSA